MIRFPEALDQFCYLNELLVELNVITIQRLASVQVPVDRTRNVNVGFNGDRL